MADTTIKKWNDTTNQWEELYPETTVSQLIATGDRDSTTFLRGDGVFSDTLTGTLTVDVLEAGSTASDIAPINVKSYSNNRAIHIEETGAGSESWQIGVDTDGDLGFYNSGSSTASVTFFDDNSVSLLGGLTIEGSINTGAYESQSEFKATAANIVLKGDDNGRSGIFFKSEKNGTNINHPSDYGFIQFHSYGRDATSGEANELIIGVSNDSTDHLIFNTPSATGIKARVGASATEYTMWNSGNDGANSGLDADKLDGYHYTDFATRIDLSSQVQLSSYRKSVIALCNLDNSDISRNSWSGGTIFFHRTNGLHAPVTLHITMEKRYNVEGANYTAMALSGDSFGDNIQYVKFDYNGTPYGGIEFYYSAAEHAQVYFIGESNFDIFGLDYYNTQTNTVLNSEVNNSISTSNMTAETDFFINNQKIFHEGNDGASSGIDADTVDSLQASQFLRSDQNDTMTGDLTLSNSNPVLQLNDTGTTTGNAYIDYQAGTSLKVHAGSDPITFIAGNSEKARITAGNGYLGVGSTNPSYGLDVHANDGQIRAYGTIAKLWAEASDAGQASLELKNTEGHFRFITDNGEYSIYDQTDGAERFRINTAGNTSIQGDLLTKGNLYLNYDNSPDGTDATIYFGDDESDTAHYMQFDDSSQLFKFSNDIYALGHVYADNHVYAKGEIRINYDNTGDAILRFGDAASDTAHYMSFSNAAQQYYLSDTLNLYGGLKLDHNGDGTVDSHAITFTSQFNNTDVVRELKTNSSGELLFNGNELATESYVDTAVSGAGGGEYEWEYVDVVTSTSSTLTYSNMSPVSYEYKFVIECQTTAEDTSNPYIRINNDSSNEYSYQYESVTQTAETTESAVNVGDALTNLIYTGADLSSYSNGGSSPSTVHRAEFVYAVSPYSTYPGMYTATIRGFAHTHYVSQTGTSYDGMVQSTFVGTKDNIYLTEQNRIDYIHNINAGSTDNLEMRVYRRARK